MKNLNTRVDTLEAVGAGTGVIKSAAQGYLPEKSTLSKIFDGSVEEWRGWKYDFADFLDTKNTGMYLFLEEIAKSRDELVGDSFIQKWWARATKDPNCRVACAERIDRWHGQNDCHVSWILS